VAGNHDDRRGDFLLLEPAQKVDAALVREFDVEDISVASGSFGETPEVARGLEIVDRVPFRSRIMRRERPIFSSSSTM
jgi:hypothetical protein